VSIKKHQYNKNTTKHMEKKHLYYTFLIILLCSSITCKSQSNDISEVHSSAFKDSISIHGKKYKIPDFWRSRKIDHKLQANTNRLVPLPQELTYKNYNIYITKEASMAFIKMANDAKKDSVYLIADSGFRSIRYQKKIIERYLNRGVSLDVIFKSVAPPGYSEHMLGTVLDFVPSNSNFGNSESYRWLKDNAWKYGFKQTYMDGVMNEPWHWRFFQM
jgi:LAS superfamily LD-carboxypeptidase LdcB